MRKRIRQKSVQSTSIRLHYHRLSGSFTLTYPRGLSRAKREQYLKQWASWMDERLQHEPPPIYEEGSVVSIFGRQRKIRFTESDAKRKKAVLDEGQLTLVGAFPTDVYEMKEAVEKLLEKELLLRVLQWKEDYETLLELPPVEVFVRAMRSRWGSCFPTRKKIHVSRYLIYKDEKFIKEVILHEFVHFLYPNHQKGFKEALKRYRI
ncbi:MAG TPA: M48 family metallopeptidase [Tissierellia bacterium]|nr:M48 family metallopeptidase [Tissierellia bacterium]